MVAAARELGWEIRLSRGRVVCRMPRGGDRLIHAALNLYRPEMRALLRAECSRVTYCGEGRWEVRCA
jgi:hypothetical protein